jgi:hypothetical protein
MVRGVNCGKEGKYVRTVCNRKTFEKRYICVQNDELKIIGGKETITRK